MKKSEKSKKKKEKRKIAKEFRKVPLEFIFGVLFSFIITRDTGP